MICPLRRQIEENEFKTPVQILCTGVFSLSKDCRVLLIEVHFIEVHFIEVHFSRQSAPTGHNEKRNNIIRFDLYIRPRDPLHYP